LQTITDQLDQIMPAALTGTVAGTVGMTITAAGFPAPVPTNSTRSCRPR